MFLDRKPHVSVWRPVYRYAVAVAFGPLMARVRTFFLEPFLGEVNCVAADLTTELGRATKQMEEYMRVDRLRAIEEQTAALRREMEALQSQVADLAMRIDCAGQSTKR